uniref:Predicted protein n=1 Tax=Hordeum vulgare subsp. vulgare TaxID=112509 RepID=F2DB14_HORVV|nr:predicted protein [Hordeum vulgare subsp. vulgare]
MVVKLTEVDSLACAPSALSISESLPPLPGCRAATTEATCILGAAGPARSQFSTAGTSGTTCGAAVWFAGFSRAGAEHEGRSAGRR